MNKRWHLPLVLVALFLPAGAPAEDDLGGAPSLVARDLDGKRFTMDTALEDGPVVLTFWATWCKPCPKELPELQKLVDAYADHGFSVAAISGDGPADQAKVRPYVRSQKFSFTVIPDPDGELKLNMPSDAEILLE